MDEKLGFIGFLEGNEVLLNYCVDGEVKCPAFSGVAEFFYIITVAKLLSRFRM